MVFICISLLKYGDNFLIKYLIKNKKTEQFTITLSGDIQFDNDQEKPEGFQLSPLSRVSFLGCWLVYSSLQSPDNLQAKFIFKDSLSSADYSRLRRVIMALKL